MLNLICKVEIISKKSAKVVRFDYCGGIEVKTSCKNLTDTAVVKVPRRMLWRGKELREFIDAGDGIEIAFGYDEYGIKTMFKGYIKSIENGVPLVIYCENEMYRFKRIDVPAERIEQFDLRGYLEKYGEGVKVDIAEGLSFGSMDIKDEMTLAEALDKIMQTYTYVVGYFQDGVFKAVLSTERWSNEPEAIVFDPTRNMVSDSLKYILADDVRICMKAVSLQRDNSQIVAFSPERAFTGSGDKRVPKSDWSQRQEFCPHCKTQQEVQDYADRRAAEFLTDKMEGSFVAFGVPLVRKGDLIELRDRDRKERDGKRFVADAVDYSFGSGGYRQTITLGYEIKS